MTTRYILDENIIELAAKGENDEGNSDFTCLTLILDILKKCDILYCSTKLLEIYRKKLKKMESNMIRSASTTAKLIKHMITQGKIKVTDDSPKINNEEDLPSDDVYLVRLAVHTKSILVSTDSPLKEKSRDILMSYNIKIVHPSEM